MAKTGTISCIAEAREHCRQRVSEEGLNSKQAGEVSLSELGATVQNLSDLRSTSQRTMASACK